MRRSVTDWYDAAFDDSKVATEGDEQLARDGDRQDPIVWCSEDEVRVGIGPYIETAREIFGGEPPNVTFGSPRTSPGAARLPEPMR